MNGKTFEQLKSWRDRCQQKIMYQIGKIPETASNDGYFEVRALWYQNRVISLEAAMDSLDQPETSNGTTSSPKSVIRPMERLPFHARPAFITKRQREETTEESNGSGEASQPEQSAPPASPIVIPPELKRPFKRPRKKEDLSKSEGSSEDTEEIDELLIVEKN